MTRGIRTALAAGGGSGLDRPLRAGRGGQGPWRESGRLRRVAPRRLHRRGRPAGLPGAGAQVQGRGRGEGASARSPSATSSRRRASAVPTGRSSPARSRPSPTAPRCSRARSAPPPTRPRRRRARRAASPRATGRRRRASASSSRAGPQVERVRRIVDTLLPPYLHPEDVRIYVIENKEWNAFAMGNYSIYVFTGLLDDMDDDEVAIVLGHELVHASHEHSRKQFKRDMWIQLVALGALGRGEHDRRRHEAGGRRARRPRRRHGLAERLRARHGGPGRPRGPALRLRGGLRHHQGAAAVEPLRQEVRRGEQGRELLLQRPLAVGGARDQAREGDRLQLPRRAEAGRPGPAGAPGRRRRPGR